MSSKYIFIDLDGTYLGHHGDNIPSAIRAVDELLANGHQIYLCTGRNTSMADLVYKQKKTGMVLMMGGYVETEGKCIYQCPMNSEDVQYLNSLIAAGDRTYTCLDDAYSEGFNYDYFKKGPDKFNVHWKKMDEYQDKDVYKFSLHVNDGSGDEIKSFINKLDKERFAYAEEPYLLDYGYSVEVTLRAVSKGKAIRLLADKGYIDLKETIGIGDSNNDLEMLETCAYSIAMGDASDLVKSHANAITAPVYEDGFYQAFRKLGLIGGKDD